jgi:hypothetical protein
VQLLLRIAQNFAAPPPHYAIVELPHEQSEINARAKFLSERNIRPLWFPAGEYEAIDVFLEALTHP